MGVVEAQVPGNRMSDDQGKRSQCIQANIVGASMHVRADVRNASAKERVVRRAIIA